MCLQGSVVVDFTVWVAPNNSAATTALFSTVITPAALTIASGGATPAVSAVPASIQCRDYDCGLGRAMRPQDAEVLTTPNVAASACCWPSCASVAGDLRAVNAREGVTFPTLYYLCIDNGNNGLVDGADEIPCLNQPYREDGASACWFTDTHCCRPGSTSALRAPAGGSAGAAPAPWGGLVVAAVAAAAY
jgi:hypothetical protein